jgi:predicted esterase
MNTKRQVTLIGFVILGLCVALIGLAGCRSGSAPEPTSTPLPTLTLDETSAEEFVISDFDAVHSPVNGDANQYLIFGNIPVSKPAADLAPDLAVFLGRWEGYDFGPPVKKDRKLVMVVQEMTAQGGTAYAWSGTNLQYPDIVKEFHFRVVRGDTPSIEWVSPALEGGQVIITFTYDSEKDMLKGWLKDPAGNYADRPYELTRDQSFYVYKDYAQYLGGKRIYSKTYQNNELQRYGAGYLLYLPEGYEDNPDKTWPLLFFLHGYGDRGDNILVLAKASPFMYIREKEPLPFIIAAPLLSAYQGYSSFPEEYMDGVLAEIRADYRVDAKRIYVTGLSMGGEATYRFAVHQPDTFAAIAPLSAYVDSETYSMLGLIKDLPVWAIHGADDTVVPLAKGQQAVDALKEAGGNVRFSVLEGHDHDTWTDTYSDPAFYDWLLQHQGP